MIQMEEGDSDSEDEVQTESSEEVESVEGEGTKESKSVNRKKARISSLLTKTSSCS